jgi:hypothetical protein
MVSFLLLMGKKKVNVTKEQTITKKFDALIHNLLVAHQQSKNGKLRKRFKVYYNEKG